MRPVAKVFAAQTAYLLELLLVLGLPFYFCLSDRAPVFYDCENRFIAGLIVVGCGVLTGWSVNGLNRVYKSWELNESWRRVLHVFNYIGIVLAIAPFTILLIESFNIK